jgi:hypothetical protein
MTEEFEKINFDEMREQQLVRDYMQNPTPEVAEELLQLAAAHKTNSYNYKMTYELEQHLIDCGKEFAQTRNHAQAYGLAKPTGRKAEDYRDISMCAHVWGIVLSGETATIGFEVTAEVFSKDDKEITYDTVKRVWERKKKVWEGEKENEYVREICRSGLDVFLVTNNRILTPEEEKIATRYLKEDVSIAAIKDQQRLRTKYKNKYKFNKVNKKIVNMNDEEYEKHFEDG